MEGVPEPIWRKIFDSVNATSFSHFMNISEFLGKNNFKKTTLEPVHVEILVKIDGNTVYCKYIDSPSFTRILTGKNHTQHYDVTIEYFK